MKRFSKFLGIILSLVIVCATSFYAKASEPDPYYLEDVNVGASYYSRNFPGIISRNHGDIHFNYYADTSSEHRLIQVRFLRDGGNVIPSDEIFGVESICELVPEYMGQEFKIEIHANQYKGDPAPDPVPASDKTNKAQASEAEMLPAKNTDGSYKLNAYGVPNFINSVTKEVTVDFAVSQKLWMSEITNAIKNKQDFNTEWKLSQQKEKESIIIASNTFISFNKETISIINAQDANVFIKFRYNNSYYETVVPANFDWTKFTLNEDWVGFAKIMDVCGGREITEEEFNN